MEIRNAIIKKVRITNEDYGILTMYLDLEHECGLQSFGGYVLYSSKHPDAKKFNYGGLFLTKVMEVSGVTRFENIVGKTVRVKGSSRRIEEIGHIVKNIWFNPEVEFEEMEHEQ